MDQIFYIAARSQEKNGGIYGYGQDDGHSCEQVFFTPLKGVSYLAYSPKRRYLYAVYKEGTANKVASYDLSDDSTLVFMNSVETHGESSCHITTDPACRYLYCANYTSGNLNEFKLENGSFSGEGRMITYSGKLGPNRRRQEHTHAHCVRFTPDYNYLCLVDLGLDEVLLFRFTPEKGIENTPAFRYRGIAESARSIRRTSSIRASPSPFSSKIMESVTGAISLKSKTASPFRHSGVNASGVSDNMSL